MMKIDKRQLDNANVALKAELVKVLGPSLPGVAGYGPGLDARSREIGLNVMVNMHAEKRLQRRLPRSIRGVPVRLAVAGIGRLD
jgi:hypothetical protein